MSRQPRLVRIATVPISLKLLLEGQPTFFRDQGFEVLTVSAAGPEVKDLLATGIPHHVVPLTRKITPWQDLVCLMQLIRLLRAIRPDIVHTHTPKAGLLGMLAAWLTRVPLRLHTVAGFPLMEATGLTRKVLALTEHITYASATHVYSNSSGLLAFMHRQFARHGSKFSVIGRGSSNGIDVLRFTTTQDLREQASQYRQQLGIPSHAFVIGFIGRLVGDKGIHELVRAFLAMDRPDVYLMLVGPFEDDRDPVDPHTKSQIQKHPRIHAVGFQADVRPWLLSFSVFVFPSYREGFPNVVMQAACLGIPSIVSDINGCNELVEAGRSGWLVPPKNEVALRCAIVNAIERPDLRETYSLNLREFVRTNFSREVVWQGLLAEYRSLLTFA